MNDNPTINEVGLEYVKTPIDKVRVVNHEKMWHVNYTKNTKNLFSKNMWFHDSKHTEYSDAYTRALNLTNEGYIKKIVSRSPVFTVKQ